MLQVKVVEVINPNSRTGKYFVASQDIGSLFGSDVEGGLSAIGKTKKIALSRLEMERKKLYDSLWV